VGHSRSQGAWGEARRAGRTSLRGGGGRRRDKASQRSRRARRMKRAERKVPESHCDPCLSADAPSCLALGLRWDQLCGSNCRYAVFTPYHLHHPPPARHHDRVLPSHRLSEGSTISAWQRFKLRACAVKRVESAQHVNSEPKRVGGHGACSCPRGCPRCSTAGGWRMCGRARGRRGRRSDEQPGERGRRWVG